MTRPTIRPRALPALLLAGVLLGAGPAPAQNGTVPLPLQELPSAEPGTERFARWLGGLRESLGIGPSSLELARRASMEGARGDDFNWLMGIAGFKLKTINSTVGLVPSLSLEFGHARELSEADREFLERALERHALRHPGPFAAVQRMIVAAILEADEIQGFGVEKLVVTLLPIPSVRFTLAPVDAPLGPEATHLMRAMDRLNQRLLQLTPRTGFHDNRPSAQPG
jgi:hypothetical protein